MRALVTGVTGQDGSYLAELLLSKGYEVHGIIRRASSFNTTRLDHVYEDPHKPGTRLFLHYGDLSSGEQLTNLIYNIRPEEIYNLGAQSHVKVSFDIPEYTGDTTGLGTTRILEAVRRSGIRTRFYQASSSEMFGSSLPPRTKRRRFGREALWRSEAVLLLADSELSASLRLIRLQRNTLQSRKPAARRDICHSQDHKSDRTDPVWQPEEALPRQFRS